MLVGTFKNTPLYCLFSTDFTFTREFEKIPLIPSSVLRMVLQRVIYIVNRF